MEKLNIKLPNGEEKKLELGKPIVALGANGAGKTRLSVKIEELNDASYQGYYDASKFLVHRLSAQKSLTISSDIIIKGLETSERDTYVGSSHEHASKISNRYQRNPVTYLINDYDKVLSLLFAKNNKMLEEHNKMDKECVLQNKERPAPLKTLIETVEEIWSSILPHRKIDLSCNEVHAIRINSRYHGKEMSDGERVILYMIVQILSVKEHVLIIIDEPELHIHKAILNKLWDKLEEIRQDCVFMYITHDLDFAVSRNVDEVLWVKSYDGNNIWDYEFIPLMDYSGLPEGLLFEVIGTQKKIVFVEGEKNSFDYLFYQEILKEKDYHVIPCGGCSQVINYVKAKKAYSKFNNIDVYGIIDRDFRTDNEISSLESDGIFVLEVAEVENLFLVPELIGFMQGYLGCEEDVVDEIKNLITNQIFPGQRNKQIQEAFASEINHQLNIIQFNTNVTVEEVRENIENKFSIENINTIFESKSDLFESATSYKEIIKVFNYKELSKAVDSKFGLKKGEYRQKVINLLKRNGTIEVKQNILDSVKPYIPQLP